MDLHTKNNRPKPREVGTPGTDKAYTLPPTVVSQQPRSVLWLVALAVAEHISASHPALELSGTASTPSVSWVGTHTVRRSELTSPQ